MCLWEAAASIAWVIDIEFRLGRLSMAWKVQIQAGHAYIVHQNRYCIWNAAIDIVYIPIEKQNKSRTKHNE